MLPVQNNLHIFRMATNNKKNGGGANGAAKVSIGVGLTAAAVAAAGAFFLYGSKNAAKNRKAVKSWALKAKAEVLEGLEAAKEMTQEEYEQLVDAAAKARAGIKNITKADLADFTREMKDNWRAIAKGAHTAMVTKDAAKKRIAAKKAPAAKPAVKAKAKKPAEKK